MMIEENDDKDPEDGDEDKNYKIMPKNKSVEINPKQIMGRRVMLKGKKKSLELASPVEIVQPKRIRT